MSAPTGGFLQQLRPASFTDPLVSLIIANGVTIVLAMAQGWGLSTTLIIYWFQSVIIGFFTVIQILLFRESGVVTESPGGRSFPIPGLRNVGLAGFFIIHYGTFHLVYLAFILFFWFMLGFDPLAVPEILLACAVFFVTHLYSFLFYRGKEETGQMTVMDVFRRPYDRIIPMHLTILFGGFAMMFFAGSGQDPSRIIVFFLLVVKTLADLWAHVRKHTRAVPSGD